MITFFLPDLAEGLQEAEILAWLIAVGDRVVADQPLVSVETDKAVVEIPSPRAGRIARLHGAPGDVLRVGAPLVDFEEDDEQADAGAVVGDLASGASAPDGTELPEFSGTDVPSRARSKLGDVGIPATPALATLKPAAKGGAKAAPAVRDLARRLGVALESVSGTGPHGSITSQDVEHAAGRRSNEPLHGTRRAMAVNMVRAQAEVARTTVVDEADIEAWSGDEDTTTRLVRAVVRAAHAEPALNAWYDARTTSRVLHEGVDLGIAVDTKDGLFVPVLRDASALDARAVRSAMAEMRRKAESHAFTPEDLHGATLTLSNFGMIAGRFAALMVMPPQVAIVGAGRIEPRVVATTGGPAVHRVLPLSLSFDHRCVFGGEAARFLRTLVEDLERDA